MMQGPAGRTIGWQHLLAIPLAALFVVHPLIVHGCSCGHDFDFHLVSWMEAARQFGQGSFHLHWAYSPAFNAGEPRFVFYPPISWTLGALLGLLLTHLHGVPAASGWDAAPVIFTWIALCASGFAMHRLARDFVDANFALLAAVLYVANPYMLFTAYERTAYAELLAAAWMPLLLLSILQEKISIPRIALPVALLWLTNAPAAVMGCYSLVLLCTLRIVDEVRRSHRDKAIHTGLNCMAGTALGLGLAAFYIVPAAYERRFVQIAMSTIGGMRIDQNFLFEHTGTSADAIAHDLVLHTASVIAVVMLTATAAAMVALLIRKPKADPASPATGPHPFPALPFALLTAAVLLLLTPASNAIWQHAPQVAFLQFPWRLLAVLAPVTALTVAAALGRLQLNSVATAAVIITFLIALTIPAYHVFHQRCYPEDTPREQFALFQSESGVDPTDEYTPLTADNDVLRTNNPSYWLAGSPTALPPQGAVPGRAPTNLSITASRAGFLILNLRDYPAWRVRRNGVLVTARGKRADGLIALPIPAGHSTIGIRYTPMADQAFGELITLLSVAILIALPRLRRRHSLSSARAFA